MQGDPPALAALADRVGRQTDEFGHFSASDGRTFIDVWGAGPFVLRVGKKTYRFEFSDRFGALFLEKDDSVAEQQLGERSPFWRPFHRWLDQGRRVEGDGVTCVVDPPRPTLYRRVGRMKVLVEEGDEGGKLIDVTADPPA